MCSQMSKTAAGASPRPTGAASCRNVSADARYTDGARYTPREISKCYRILLVKTRNLLHVFTRSASQRATGTFGSAQDDAGRAGCCAMRMRAAPVGTGVLDCPFSGNTVAHHGNTPRNHTASPPYGAERSHTMRQHCRGDQRSPVVGILPHYAATHCIIIRQAPSGTGGGGKRTLPA